MWSFGALVYQEGLAFLRFTAPVDAKRLFVASTVAVHPLLQEFGVDYWSRFAEDDARLRFFTEDTCI